MLTIRTRLQSIPSLKRASKCVVALESYRGRDASDGLAGQREPLPRASLSPKILDECGRGSSKDGFEPAKMPRTHICLISENLDR